MERTEASIPSSLAPPCHSIETEEANPLETQSLEPELTPATNPPRDSAARRLKPNAPGEPPKSFPSEDRHSRKCQICNHPEREAIEEEFVNWHYPWNISAAYKVPGRSLYRHAHAMGLFAQREHHLRSALERILERSEEANVTGETVIRAVRAYTCLTDDNRWVEPASHVIYSARPLPDNVAVPMHSVADQGPIIETSGALIDIVAIRK